MIDRRLVCAMAVLAPFAAWAQTSDAKFAAFLAGVRAEALRAGVDAGTLDAALGGGPPSITPLIPGPGRAPSV